MIFVTVGTAFPFDRLIRALDDLASQGKIEEEIFAQVGKGGYQPANFDYVETLTKEVFDTYFEKAGAIIAHAGMGTITMALEQKKPLLVMPRLKEYNELVNNHQLVTTKRFEQLGHVLAIYHTDDLPTKLKMLATFQPISRKNQAKQVAEHIGRYLFTLI